MFIAQKESGEPYSLAGKTDKSLLDQMRKSESFACPECGKKVIMKLGDKKIWHFAHVREEGCLISHERESSYHMAGKLQLYQWLLGMGMESELEKLEPNSRQRADAAADWEDQKYALEFQCSGISEEIFKKRTDGYLSNGWIPVWILGGNQIRRTSAHAVSLNEFHFLFLRRHRSGWILPAYCADSRQFILLTNIHPMTTSKALCSFTFRQSGTMEWDILFDPPQHGFLPNWNKELESYKLHLLRNPRAMESGFQQELYLSRLNIQLLPPEIGIPVHSSPYLRTPPFIWQSYLFLDLFRHLPKGKLLKSLTIEQAFQRRIRKGDIKTRHLPLAGHGGPLEALREYVTVLVTCCYLEVVEPGLYRIARKLETPKTVEDQAAKAGEFYRTYLPVLF